jgi:ribosomal protein S19
MSKKIKPRFIPYSIPKFPVVSRRMIITQRLLGKYFSVYNGRLYITVLASSLRLGTKFGDYALTRMDCQHFRKKKKKK